MNNNTISIDGEITPHGNHHLLRSHTDKKANHTLYQTLYSTENCLTAAYTTDSSDHLKNTNGEVIHIAALPKASSNETNWLHFVGINDSTLLKNILQPYGIHELVIEDILNTQQRPKLDNYGHYIFISARVYQYQGNKLQADQVYLIIGSNFVFTFQQRPIGLFTHLRKQLVDSQNAMRHHNAAFLSYQIIDRIVDDYFMILDNYNQRAEKLDNKLFGDNSNNSDLLNKIHKLKRDVIKLRRTLMSLRDVIGQLLHNNYPVFSGETHIYLRDAHDHAIQILESFDSSRELVMSMMDIYLSFQSNRLNQQMRVLTVITIIFMPLTVITGIYGMNFDNMPELHWHYGYYAILALMATIIIGLLTFFHRRHWL